MSRTLPPDARRLLAVTVALVQLCACLAAGGAGCTRSPTTPGVGEDPGCPEPAGNVLRVITEPPGAMVEVDGEGAGRTPVDVPVAAGVPLKVAIRPEGGSAFETTLQSAAGVPLAVLYLSLAPGVEDLAHYLISSSAPAAEIYLDGGLMGETPLELFLGITRDDLYLLVAQGAGCAPERQYLRPFDSPAAYPFRLSVGARPATGQGGPVALPAEAQPPSISWPAAFRAELAGQTRDVFAGPDGLFAVFVEHGLTETIYVVDARPQSEGSGVPAATPVVTWRTKELAWNEHSWEYGALAPVAWHGDRLYFLAPEPPPDGGAPALLGMGLWEVGSTGEGLRRLSWWPHWSLGALLESAWLTADGEAAVIHTRDRKASHFRVVDLARGSERVITADVPTYEPGGRDIAKPSPDGGSVAWCSSEFNPRPGGEVVVLDLRTGLRHAYRPGSDEDDELLGDITWSPDGRMLAVAHARGDDANHWILRGEDGSVLFPARFVVISDTCAEVAELSVAGQVLYPSPAWSPVSDEVALKTAVITPVSEDRDPEQTHQPFDHRFYTGPLAGPFALVHAAEDDGVSPDRTWCDWFGFLPDGRPAFGLTTEDNRHLTRVFEAPGWGTTVLELDGYSPVYAWSRAARARTDPATEYGLLLRSGDFGLYLLRPDGTPARLTPEECGLYVTQLEGNCVVAAGMDGGWFLLLLDRVPR